MKKIFIFLSAWFLSIVSHAQGFSFDFINPMEFRSQDEIKRGDNYIIKVRNVNRYFYQIDCTERSSDYHAAQPIPLPTLIILPESFPSRLFVPGLNCPEQIDTFNQLVRELKGLKIVYESLVSDYTNPDIGIIESKALPQAQKCEQLRAKFNSLDSVCVGSLNYLKVESLLKEYLILFKNIRSVFEFSYKVKNTNHDRIKVELKFTPENRLNNNDLTFSDPRTMETRLYAKHGFTFSLSAGLYGTTLNSKEFYWTEGLQHDTINLVNGIQKSYYKIGERKSKGISPGVASLGHFNYMLTPGFSIGLGLGFGVSYTDRIYPDFLYGLSFGFLNDTRLMLTLGGVLGYRTSGIVPTLNASNTYSYEVKNNYDLSKKDQLIRDWMLRFGTVSVTFQLLD